MSEKVSFWENIFEDVDFGDIRRNARVIKISNEIEGEFGRSASSSFETQASAKAASRFLKLKTVTPEKLFSNFIESNFKSLNCKHVLIIQDTTEMGFSWRKKPIEGLGPATKEGSQGFFLHPGMIVNPENESVLGLAAAFLWAREAKEEKKNKELRKKDPIEEKESYRWLLLPEIVNEHIDDNIKFTIVADRESDIYELFLAHKRGRYGSNCNLLIRAAQNRLIDEEKDKLFDLVQGWDEKGETEIKIEGNSKRTARKSKFSIKYGKVTLSVPNKKKSKIEEKIENIYIVQAEEKNTPEKEEPVKWTLLTTNEVHDFESALEIIEWYKCRWFIEELFRILKSGYKADKVKFDNGHALMNWCSLRLMMAIRLFHLLKQRDNNIEDSALPFFSQEEIKILEYVEKRYLSAKSEIDRPGKRSLSWSVLMLALLGGYKAYPSAKPPGQETVWRGMDKLESAIIGFIAASD